MNVYVVVEGERTEKLAYASWIPMLNPKLSQVHRLEDALHNNFFLEAGFGFPQLFNVIEAAMDNIATYQPHGYQLYDRLVVVVDSEDDTLQDKYNEIRSYIDRICINNNWVIDCHIIVQHFCFETWALGNRKLLRGNISNLTLAQYVKSYNVKKYDPELLTPHHTVDLNRSKYAFRYLKLLCNEKFPRQGYSKSNPGPVCHQDYLQQLISRREDDGHINSLGALLTAFV